MRLIRQIQNTITSNVEGQLFITDGNTPQVGEQLKKHIFETPWGHHKILVDKYLNGDLSNMVFYAKKYRVQWMEQKNTERYETNTDPFSEEIVSQYHGLWVVEKACCLQMNSEY